jgi:hypothetical protein
MMIISVVVFMCADYYNGAGPSISIRPPRRRALSLSAGRGFNLSRAPYFRSAT